MTACCRTTLLAIVVATTAGSPAQAQAQAVPDTLAGHWRAALELAGGELRFRIEMRDGRAVLCNAGACEPFSAVTAVPGSDSVVFEMADYAASIRARVAGDSLTGFHWNVGNRGPRTIPFRAARGTWPAEPPGAMLVGQWDATFRPTQRPSPRMIHLRPTERGLEGTIVSNSGDYGAFWGGAVADSFAMAHYDGSFIYLLTGRLDGDTLRGVFHAGLRSQTPFVAVRSTGRPHLTPPTEVVRADTSEPFTFAFPSVDGGMVTSDDARFRDKVVIVEIFGTWCPTCHDSAPLMAELYDRFHDRGLEIVGLAYEVTGDTAVDGALVRRYRDKFGIGFPLLLAGINDGESAGETQPQLVGSIAYPTTIFLDRSGSVRKVHAGFYGPALKDAHAALRREFLRTVEALLAEPPPP